MIPPCKGRKAGILRIIMGLLNTILHNHYRDYTTPVASSGFAWGSPQRTTFSPSVNHEPGPEDGLAIFYKHSYSTSSTWPFRYQ